MICGPDLIIGAGNLGFLFCFVPNLLVILAKLRWDSKKLGKFISNQNGETDTDSWLKLASSQQPDSPVSSFAWPLP